MKMTHEEIAKWAEDHNKAEMEGKLTSRLEKNYHKYTWSNGDSYEWVYQPCGVSTQIITIIINGETVSREKWESGWLENGNWENKVIEELPLIRIHS